MAELEYISVQEAIHTVLAAIKVLPSESAPLLEAIGRVLAEPVTALESLPPFANSSMDGYALRAADVVQATANNPITLRVLSDIAAGDVPKVFISEGTSARIMTGAVVPKGADAVVPVEDTGEPWRHGFQLLPDQIEIRRAVKSGDHVRHPGEDIVAGTEVLPAGRVIRPQEIGVLASLGFSQVPVFKRPRVAILATGDELVGLDEPLQPGKIRNSNNYALAAQVSAIGGIPILLGVAGDTEAEVRARLQLGLDSGVDMFVSSAGVSVGAYDVVKAVLESEAPVSFWRVRMKPGKPLVFTTYKGLPYFGLPGNPVSALVSFERFARPAILLMAGHTLLERPTVQATIDEAVESDGRETYIRAIIRRGAAGYQAMPVGKQGSHMLTSLTEANALIILPEGVKAAKVGTRLTAIMLDWPTTVF